MPAYVCSRCHAIENSATGNIWNSTFVYPEAIDPPLCSECETGKWQGRFEKKIVTCAEDIKDSLESFVYTAGFGEPGIKWG